MKRLTILLACLLPIATVSAQTELTTGEAMTYFQPTTKIRTSVHDPSVVYQSSSRRYYIFGSHKSGAWSTDLQNWTWSAPTWCTSSSTNASNATAFTTPAVKSVTINGTQRAFPSFNAMDWSARSDSGYDINGNMWAPDVIWNPTMQKWCYYLSINGDQWHSSIILLTSDNITGPYLYQGPVVCCGFYDTSHSYKDTDLELVLGTQSSLPARYNRGSNWGKRWPHTIDPSVFYDENGKLWLVYGSWSGGIWMLELDESTGLRDYNVSYPVSGGDDGVTSDPYFGTKIAGGYYVSGEGPYIEHIGNYYYLFVSYGFYSPDGGYEMRVFRSSNPNGPYTDCIGTSAIFTSYKMNYGTSGDKRGEKVMGAYNNWGTMTVGECAQGHNSIIAAEDGRTYLVYHTKFNNNSIFHEVRVHQVFVNAAGWLVAAPFEYNGETTTDAQIATQKPFTKKQIAGTYQVLVHKYGMNYANYEEVHPVEVTLDADGNVNGALSGTYSVTSNTGYITLTLGGVKYQGVLLEEQMDGQRVLTVSFTACSTSGVNIWGWKRHPKCDLAWQVLNQTVPVSNGQAVAGNLDLAGMSLGLDGVTLTWSSSHPDIISTEGIFNPTSLTEDTPVTLTAHLESPGYYWTQSYTVTAKSLANSMMDENMTNGLVAHYGFDDTALSNSYNTSEHATLLNNGNGQVPTLETGDAHRTGAYPHLYFGLNGNESYIQVPNPLYGQTLSEGATLSFWVNRQDDNLWDALFGFVNGNARFYMTGNTYMGYNDNAGTWVDINHPNNVTTGNIGSGEWHHVTLTLSRSTLTLYVDGTAAALTTWAGSCNGRDVSSASGFDFNLIVDHLSNSSEFDLGRGSFWGSAPALYDDLLIYNRPLNASEVADLYDVSNSLFDFSTLPDIAKAKVSMLIARARALASVPHTEEVAGANAALESTLTSIEQQLPGSTLTSAPALLTAVEEALFTFLCQVVARDPEQPFDLTYLLSNPGMDSAEGWSGTPTINFSCGEYYQQTFDFYQTVKSLPGGNYQFLCNAFQRPGWPADCPNVATTARIYAGSSSRQLAHITLDAQSSRLGGDESYVNGQYFPNNMEAASIYFSQGLYDNHVTTMLHTDGGSLTMGLRGTTMNTAYWCIFDNFRLHYFGSLDSNVTDNFKYVEGDVNCDGVVSISDVTCLVDEILGGAPPVICYRAADINTDGLFSVADVTTLVNLILSK